jgi:hypothetical protein
LLCEIFVRKRVLPIAGKAGLATAPSARQHHIYGKIGSIVRISVPVHGNQPLKLGLMRHLLKLAGINEDQV